MKREVLNVVLTRKPPAHSQAGGANEDVVVVAVRSGEMFKGQIRAEGDAVVIMNDKEWIVVGADEIIYITVPPPKAVPIG